MPPCPYPNSHPLGRNRVQLLLRPPWRILTSPCLHDLSQRSTSDRNTATGAEGGVDHQRLYGNSSPYLENLHGFACSWRRRRQAHLASRGNSAYLPVRTAARC